LRVFNCLVSVNQAGGLLPNTRSLVAIARTRLGAFNLP
jgi:hypothetical protein